MLNNAVLIIPIGVLNTQNKPLTVTIYLILETYSLAIGSSWTWSTRWLVIRRVKRSWGTRLTYTILSIMVHTGGTCHCWENNNFINIMKCSSICSILTKIWAALWENQQCGFHTGLTQTELHKHRRWQETGNFDLESRGIVLSVYWKQRCW